MEGVELQIEDKGEVEISAERKSINDNQTTKSEEMQSVGQDKMAISTLSGDEVVDKVVNVGLRTLGGLVNGGLTVFALGALSPVAYILRRLDNMEEEEEEEETARHGSGEES
jgi:hypothetical protein